MTFADVVAAFVALVVVAGPFWTYDDCLMQLFNMRMERLIRVIAEYDIAHR